MTYKISTNIYMHTYKNKFPETLFLLTIFDEIYFLFLLIKKKQNIVYGLILGPTSICDPEFKKHYNRLAPH